MPTNPVIYTEVPARKGNIGLITLNRPEALNALSGEMIMSLKQQLETWAHDPNINMVLIQSGHEKAFCAGGDLKMVARYGIANYKSGLFFYEAEYKLDLFIHDYPKPYVALLNGITMGGGCGISILGTRVIASERLGLAMPEVGIGFYPDAGATYFLSRCPHYIGFYLGLTGNVIGVMDALYAGLVDAYVPSKYLNNIMVELINSDLTQGPLAQLDKIIAKFAKKPGSPGVAFNALLAKLAQKPGATHLEKHLSIIESCFSKPSVEAIMEALGKNGSHWAKEQLATLSKRCPMSLKATLHALQKGAQSTAAQCLDMEFKLTVAMMDREDIYEGIRAILIDKTHDPKWKPAELKDIDEQQVKALFN